MVRLVLALVAVSLIYPAATSARPPEVEQLARLYKELMTFKVHAEFKRVGFGACCKYNAWMKRVEKLRVSSSSQMWLELGVSPGDLLTLGLEYMRSKGGETDYSREMSAQFAAALFPRAAKKEFNGRMSDTDRVCRELALYKTHMELVLASNYTAADKLISDDKVCPRLHKGTPVRGPLETQSVNEIVYVLVEAQGVGRVWVMEDWVEFK